MLSSDVSRVVCVLYATALLCVTQCARLSVVATNLTRFRQSESTAATQVIHQSRPVHTMGREVVVPTQKSEELYYKEVDADHQHGKPRLVSKQPSETEHDRNGRVQTVPSVHCKQCIDELNNLTHFCSLKYHYGMEVVVRNRTKNGYFVEVIKVLHYKTKSPSGDLKGSKRTQVLHLKLPASDDPYNIAFSNCHCTRLNSNRTYIAFGHFDNGTRRVHHSIPFDSPAVVDETEFERIRNIVRDMFVACNPVDEGKRSPNVTVAKNVSSTSPPPPEVTSSPTALSRVFVGSHGVRTALLQAWRNGGRKKPAK